MVYLCKECECCCGLGDACSVNPSACDCECHDCDAMSSVQLVQLIFYIRPTVDVSQFVNSTRNALFSWVSKHMTVEQWNDFFTAASTGEFDWHHASRDATFWTVPPNVERLIDTSRRMTHVTEFADGDRTFAELQFCPLARNAPQKKRRGAVLKPASKQGKAKTKSCARPNRSRAKANAAKGRLKAIAKTAAKTAQKRKKPKCTTGA